MGALKSGLGLCLRPCMSAAPSIRPPHDLHIHGGITRAPPSLPPPQQSADRHPAYPFPPPTRVPSRLSCVQSVPPRSHSSPAKKKLRVRAFHPSRNDGDGRAREGAEVGGARRRQLFASDGVRLRHRGFDPRSFFWGNEKRKYVVQRDETPSVGAEAGPCLPAPALPAHTRIPKRLSLPKTRPEMPPLFHDPTPILSSA